MTHNQLPEKDLHIPIREENSHTIHLKEEFVRWLLSVLGGIALFLPVAFIIQKIYHPDIAQRMETAKKLLISSSMVMPEPMEAMLFRVGIVTIFLGMLGCYQLLSKSKLPRSLTASSFFRAFSALVLLLVIAIFYFDFAAPNPFPDGPEQGYFLGDQNNFNNFFGQVIPGWFAWGYTLALFPLTTYLFFGIKKYGWEGKKTYKRIVAGIGYPSVIAMLAALVVMNTFSFPYSWQQKNDFTAVYYSATQVYAGVPMLVGHFTDTYGLYPHFLAPVFKLIGLSVVKFTLVMSLLLAMAFALNFFFLKRWVHNKVILFSGFFTLIMFSYLGPRLSGPYDSIFAFFPIRYLLPSVLVVLATNYFTKRSATIYWLTCFFTACGVLWNPELGIVCCGSWLLTNTYYDWYGPGGKVQLKKIARHWLAVAGILVAVFYCWKLLIYLCYGTWPDMSILFSTMSVFENIGLNLLPMVLVHPWNVMTLVLCTGFLYAIVNWSKKQVTSRAAIILLLSLISLGFFFYFQGRSHNWNFSASSGFCIMLLVLLGNELWQWVKTKDVFALNGLFIIFLFIISFSFFEALLNTDKIYAAFFQQKEKDEQSLEQQMYEGNKEFFLQKTSEYQKVHILSSRKYPAMYFDGSKRINATNPGLEDLFLASDLRQLEADVRDSSADIFIEPYNLGHMPFINHSLAIAGAAYQYKDVHETMYLLEKRTSPIPSQTFFGNTEAMVIHRKYTDDTAGIGMRVRDGDGLGKVSLNSGFSIQVLFYPDVQMFPYATIIGNSLDNNGFVFSKVLYSRDYLFGLDGKSWRFPVPFYQWDYCVINIYPTHLDVYQNGSLVTTFPVDGPMRQSLGQLCIGNINGQHYLIGPISEVAVANKAIDSTVIRQTWQAIAQSIKAQ